MRVTMASCHGEGLALRMLLLKGVELLGRVPCERFFGHWARSQKGSCQSPLPPASGVDFALAHACHDMLPSVPKPLHSRILSPK